MADYKGSHVTSIHGRRLGIMAVTSSVTGSTVGPQASPSGRVAEFLVGPEAVRRSFSTAETSGVSLASYGISHCSTAIVAATTSTKYTLDKPIPGVSKFINWGSSNTATNMVSVWASSDGSIGIESSQGTTMCVMVSTQGFRGVTELMGISSTSWAVVGSLSSGVISMTTLTT